MKLQKEAKQRWIAALKSGDYKKGRHSLHLVDAVWSAEKNRYDDDHRYCCLGVAQDVFGLEASCSAFLDHRAFATLFEDEPRIAEVAQLQTKLATFNDDSKGTKVDPTNNTFDRIIKYIQRYL